MRTGVAGSLFIAALQSSSRVDAGASRRGRSVSGAVARLGLHIGGRSGGPLRRTPHRRLGENPRFAPA